MIKIKIRYVLVAAGVSSIVAIASLRDNNLQMVVKREAVYTADKNNGDVRGALTELQHYVNGHMNTDLTPGRSTVYPPIQLKYTYERLKAQAGGNANNDQIYSDAQTFCESQNSSDFSGRNRIPCIQEYVQSHGATVPGTVPDSLYKFDFVSPLWSPDRAGWTSLVTILLVLVAAALAVKRYAIDTLRRK